MPVSLKASLWLPPIGRLLHSWNPKGVDDWGIDAISHEFAQYEWAGFLPMLKPGV